MSAPNTPDQVRIAREWLDITVERFLRNIQRLKIGNTGQLAASFRKEVIGAAGDDQLRVRLAYALYGRFVDQGVGRGMAAGARRGTDEFARARNELGQLRRHQRRPKTWYSREIGYQSYKLAELMSDATGQILISTFSAELPTKPTTVNL